MRRCLDPAIVEMCRCDAQNIPVAHLRGVVSNAPDGHVGNAGELAKVHAHGGVTDELTRAHGGVTDELTCAHGGVTDELARAHWGDAGELTRRIVRGGARAIHSEGPC
jgi:hypothetical protein